MRSSRLSDPLLGCLVLGLTMAGCAVATDPTAEQAIPSQPSASDGQTRVAEATLKLENAFADQFARGRIDRAALQGPIHDVVDAMPETARAKVQQRVARVLDRGEQLVAQLTPEQRADVAAAPAQRNLGEVQLGLISAWGLPGALGFGGIGAFSFPGMYTYGSPYALGYGYPAGAVYGSGYASGSSYHAASSYDAASSSGSSCGLFGCYGLGGLGWFW